MDGYRWTDIGVRGSTPIEPTPSLPHHTFQPPQPQEFKAQVTKLRHALAEQLKQPKHFAGTGKVLTGPKIASLVPQIVATLNSGARVLPKSAYAALIESEVARVQATYLRRLQRALQEAKRAAEAAPLATPALQVGRVALVWFGFGGEGCNEGWVLSSLVFTRPCDTMQSQSHLSGQDTSGGAHAAARL